MKKTILLSCMAFLCIQGFAYPILSRTTMDRGIFGYRSTSSCLVETVIAGKPSLGWMIECSGGGLEHCPNRSNLAVPQNPSEGDPDEVDLSACGSLLEYADARIAESEGKSSGIKVIRKRVEGEEQERIYTLNWFVNENGNTITTIDKSIAE